VLTIAVEGISDEAVIRRLCGDAGLGITAVHVARGKPRLDARVAAYNFAARHGDWLVLRDLDHDAECPANLRDSLLPNREPRMHFRVPVRSVETWLMSDREGLARFLSISSAIVPRNPELLDNPKLTLVNLAGRSGRRQIREDFVPAAGTTATVGPGYTARIQEFARGSWDPVAAASNSDSLSRCIALLSRI
jgi:hypothetical protein